MEHITDNQDALLDYLYEEGDAAERLKVARHLQECVACSVAVLEMQSVRGILREWTPPPAELGFRIVQERASAPARARFRWMPATFGGWAQAAAAVLLFAAGMAVSQLTVRYEDGAVIVGPRATGPASQARTTSVYLPAQSGGRIEAATASAERQDAGAGRADAGATEDLLRQVRALIQQSEMRQQRELALRLSQVAREVDTQHQADLVRIQQNLGEIELQTGAQIDQQRQMMDYLVRTAGER